MKNENPLVSVMVVTYNSSEFVIETLESIKRQSYDNIELVISDDCSKDETPAICKSWLKKNKERFVNAVFVTTPKNMGVAGNMNNGLKHCNGEWVRDIDGDDMLTDDSIATYVSYIKENKEYFDIILAKCKRFGDAEILSKTPDWFHYSFVKFTHKQLLYCVLRSNFIPDSTALVSKRFYNSVGGYDENIPLLEDWPFWIKAISLNAKIGFIDKETVLYRIRENSLSNGSRSPLYMESELKAKEYAMQVQYKTSKLLWLHTFSMKKMSSSNYMEKIFFSIIWLLNPMTYYMKALTKQLKK